MGDLDELLAELWRAPDAWEGWLVVSDWLTEHGDARGRLIRLLHLQMKREAPGRTREIEALIAEHEPSWRDGLEPPEEARPRWQRGFVTGVRLDEATPAALAWLTALLAHPSGRLLRYVDLGLTRLDARPLAALLAIPGCARIPEWNLHWCELGDEAFRDFLEARPPESLRSLSAAGNHLTNAPIQWLAEGSWPALRYLDLGENLLGDAAALALARAHGLPGLAELYLGSNLDLTDVGARALVETTALGALAVLGIETEWGIPDDVLASAPEGREVLG